MLAPHGHEALVLQGGMSTAKRRAVVTASPTPRPATASWSSAPRRSSAKASTPPHSTPCSSPPRSPSTACSSSAPDESSAPHPAKTSPRCTTTTTGPPRSSPPRSNAACPDTGHSASARRNRPGGRSQERPSSDERALRADQGDLGASGRVSMTGCAAQTHSDDPPPGGSHRSLTKRDTPESNASARRAEPWRPVPRIVTDKPACHWEGIGRIHLHSAAMNCVQRIAMGAADLHTLYSCRSARLRAIIRDEEAAGSNPVTPTTFSHVSDVLSVHCGSANGPVGGIWEDRSSIMDWHQIATTTHRSNLGRSAQLRDVTPSQVAQRSSTAPNRHRGDFMDVMR